MQRTRRTMLQLLASLPLLAAAANERQSPPPITRNSGKGVEGIRGLLPQLAAGDGSELAYLDSAATSLRPRPVLDAMREFYELQNANPARGLHSAATRAADAFDAARSRIARFIHTADPLEIIWTRGTTEGLNLVASAWGAAHLKPGDEILLTVAEHASNMLPWQLVAKKTRATVRYMEINDEGHLDLDALDRLLSRRTKLVCFAHVSNVLGAINPTREICRRAKEVGARVVVDAAQSVPHFPVDVQELGCDFLAFSSHKMLGPMGAGVLWARRDAMDEMQPYQAGSNMAHARSLTEWEYSPGALRFGAGTPSVADAVGLAAAATLLKSLDRDELWRAEQVMTRYALERMRSVPRLRLLGPASPDNRISVFSFVLDGVPAQTIASELDKAAICVRAGDLASMPLLQRFKVKSAARASLYVYTSEHEVDRLVEALHAIAA